MPPRQGDTVRVSPGTYRETIRLKPGVIVRSVGDSTKGKLGLERTELTIIDGGGASTGPAVTLAERAVLDGFSISGVGRFDPKEYDKHYATHGENLPDDRGAAGKDFPAIAIPGVNATVRYCIVHDNGHAGIGCVGAKDQENRSRIFKNIVYRNMGSGIGVADGAAPSSKPTSASITCAGGSAIANPLA